MTDEDNNRKLPSKAVQLVAEQIEQLSDEERQELFSFIQHVKIEASTTTVVSGPIPPPEMLAGYEEVSPGSSRLIIEMARDQQNFNFKALESDLEIRKDRVSNQRLLISLTTLSNVGLLFLAAFALYLGQQWVALPFGGLPFLAYLLDRFLPRKPKTTDQPPK